MITAERLRKVASYNADTGLFTWAVTRKRCVKGKQFGTLKDNGYLHAGIDGHKYLLHLLAWLFVYGEFPNNDVDHIDGCRTNNRIANLRSVSRSVNLENIKRAKCHNKSTGLLGAYACRDKFTSRIQVKGKSLYLGVFNSKEAAHEAYMTAKRNMHEGNTL